jgi:O-antigen/teichoic acid export membrane protein
MKLLKSTFKLGTGTLIAQGITFASIPIISRIYSPAEYGQLTFLLSTTGIFIPVVTLKIETLIITIAEENKMKNYFKFSIFISTVMSILIGTLFFAFLSVNNRNDQQINITISILFCAILFVQSITVLTVQLSLRARNYKNIAQSGVVQNASTNALQICLGKIEPTAIILVASYFLGRILGILPMAKLPINMYRESKVKSRKIAMFKTIVKENKYLIPAGILEVGNSSVIVFIIAIFFGYQYSGFVGLAQSLLLVPVTLFAGSFGSIVSAEFSAVNRDITKLITRKRELISEVIKPVLVIFIGYIIFFLTAANYLLAVVFNNDWDALSELIPFLTLPLGVYLLWNPFISLLYVEKRWVRLLKINSVRFLAVCLSSLICIILNQNWKVTTIVMFAVGAAVQLSSMALSFNRISRSLPK